MIWLEKLKFSQVNVIDSEHSPGKKRIEKKIKFPNNFHSKTRVLWPKFSGNLSIPNETTTTSFGRENEFFFNFLNFFQTKKILKKEKKIQENQRRKKTNPFF